MKKTKYYYEHRYASPSFVTSSEIKQFYDTSGTKLHVDGNKFYTYEFVGNEVSWFNFLKSEEIEVSDKIIAIPKDNRYENGYNWKNTHISGANSKIRKQGTSTDYDPKWVKEYNNPTKIPINPKTGLRDGKN